MPEPITTRRRECALVVMAHCRVCGRPKHDERPALPAGHPISWGLLTNGTVLDGAEYPFPVFNSD